MPGWNVIWQVDPDDPSSCVERDWFEEITALIPKNSLQVDYRQAPLLGTRLPWAIACVSSPNQTSPVDMARYLQSLPGPKVLYHMSDEYLDVGHEFYRHCDLVIRNGSRMDADEGVALVQIPSGYASGLGNVSGEFRPASQRKCAFAFMGTIKNDRKSEMLPALLEINGPSFVKQTLSFSDSTRFFGNTSITVYKNAVFVPNPKGNWNPECNRLYDALEWGCIPLMKRYRDTAYHESYFDRLFGDHPLPTFDDWPAAAGFANAMLVDPFRLDELQNRIAAWWRAYKNSLQTTLAERIGKIAG